MKHNNQNKQIIFNSLSTVLLTGINFFTTPIFTRLLGAAQYGKYNVYNSWVAILLPIVCLETHACIGPGKYKYENEYTKFKKNLLYFGCTTSICFFVIFLIFRKSISLLLGFSETMVIVLIVFSIASYIVEYVKNINAFEKKAEINFIISAFLVISSSILSIILIKNNIFGELFEERALGAAIPYILFSLAFLGFFILKNRKIEIDFSMWKYALLYGYPIVFHLLSYDALNQANKLLLEYLGYEGVTVGVYSFMQVFSSAVVTIMYALNNSWCPFYYDDLNKQDIEKINRKVKNYIELFTVICIGFILLSREVCYLFATEEYMFGINLLPIFISITYLTFMYQFPVNFEYYNGKTKLITIGTIIAGLANIIFNYLLIPEFGMYGSAIASLISYLILFCCHFVMANRIEEMHFHVKIKDFMCGVVCLIISYMLFFFAKDLWIVRWLIGAIIGLYELLKIIKRKSIF